MGRFHPDLPFPAPAISRVPLEVWHSILRMATNNPDSFPTSFLQAPPLTALTRTRYQENMKTKRSVSLVCRLWRDLSLPFLYEHVKMLHLRTLATLLRSIVDSISFKNGRMSTYGDHLRRLDVSLCDLNQDCKGSDVLDRIQFLLRNLPNLRVLLFKDLRCFQKPLRNMYAMKNWRFFLDAVSPKLEVMSWIDGASVSPALWISFFRSHPHLHAVQLPCSDPPLKPGPVHVQLLQLEEVVSCARRDLLFFPKAFSSSDLPNLKRLIHFLPYNQDYRPSYHGHDPFFLTHGKKLVSVHFWSFNRVGEFPLVKYLDTVQETCPRAEEIGLSCYWNEVVRFPSLPNVTELTVRHLFPQFGKRDCKALLKSLVEAKGRGLVNLEVVRFLDERNLEHLKRHFEGPLMFALKELMALGVVVEGCEGFVEKREERRGESTSHEHVVFPANFRYLQ